MSNAGFLLAEDAAVKYWFSKLTVSDDRSQARPVKVFFRYPENETERSYPFATIELIDIIHSVQRQHSDVTLYGSTSTAASAQYTGPNALTYLPSTQSGFSEYANEAPLVWTEEFIPVDLLYQVSTFTRSALHDRQLSSQILTTLAPFRSRYLHVPEDDTYRRIQLLDWITADLLDPEAGYRKRIFRKIYTIQIGAEMAQEQLMLASRVLSVQSDIIDTNTSKTETVTIT